MSELSIDQKPEGWNKDVASYDASFASFSALFAKDALRLVRVKPGQRVLDICTGTGALALIAAEAGAEVLAVDFSQGMIDYLGSKIRQKGMTTIRAALMDCQALEVEDSSFDAAFSIFGVSFFPDRVAGFRELHRVLRPGGLAAVVNWCIPERPDFFRLIGGVLKEVFPNVSPPKSRPPFISLAHPDLLRSEMGTGGFATISLFYVRHIWTFPDQQAEKVCDSLIGGLPVLAKMLESRDDQRREAFRSTLIRELRQRQGEGPYGLEGEAHIAIARK